MIGSERMLVSTRSRSACENARRAERKHVATIFRGSDRARLCFHFPPLVGPRGGAGLASTMPLTRASGQVKSVETSFAPGACEVVDKRMHARSEA